MYRKAIQGVSMVGLGVLLAKAISMLSFYFVGTYLDQAQIGEYAAIVGLIGIFAACQNGGIEPLAVQRGSHRRGNIGNYLAYALKLNLIIAPIALAAAAFVFQGKPTSLIISALLIFNILASPGFFYIRTKYMESGEFRKLAMIEVSSSLSQYGILIFLLMLTAHQVSFGLAYLPMILFGIAVTFNKFSFRASPAHSLAIFNKSKWLIASSFLTGAVLNSPYLVLGIFESPPIVGLFYFSNQLVYSLSTLLGKPIQSVILPILKENGAKQAEIKQKFSRMVTAFGIAMLAACLICSVYLTPILLNAVWGDKWIDSAPIVSLAFIALAIRVNNVFFWAYSQALGDWSLRARLLLLELVALFVVTVTICMHSDDAGDISKGIYTLLMFSALANQIYMAFKYKLNTKALNIAQLFVIAGVYFA